MKKLIATFVVICAAINVPAQFTPERYPVIPRPQTILPLAENFPFSAAITIVTEEKSARKEADYFRKEVLRRHNIHLRYERFAGFEPYIYIQLDSSFVPAEGYRLIVTKSGIDVYGTRAGVFYGLQTLLQLIQKDPQTQQLIIPGCNIIDYPRFQWRGMHLDVARHFFPKENVKEYLRYMAMYKLNTFHWHLTDDQGWRIEIKKYPLLTSVGAWRNATLMGHFSEEPDRYDSTRYGGYYTQEEVKEIVAYADSLHITVVPEIEMPGHARALIAAYPYCGNNPDIKGSVACTWGVFSEVLSPKESTFTLLEGVLEEVCALFPGKYIHIGGDECPKDEWKQSAYCQQLIREKNLKDEHGLQSWFIQRIVNFLGKKNKKAIGWDEILEGDLPEGAAVMSWRGSDGGIEAARQEHPVVMTPTGFCYFDYYQSQNSGEPLAIGGYLPIEKVYSFEPVPAALTPEERKYILGVQGNLWTEYIPTFSQVQYMIFPRMAALAEIGWCTNSVKNFDHFAARLATHFEFYRTMGINHSRALYEIHSSFAPDPDGNGVLLTLSSRMPFADIRYNYGGFLNLGDSVYTQPVLVNRKMDVQAGLFLGEEQLGPVLKMHFHGNKAMGKPVALRKAPSSSYNNGGAATLTNGITGRTPWTGSEWLGWLGDTLDVVIDLQKSDTIRSVTAVCLEDRGSWIHHPYGIDLYLSDDGVNFRQANPRELHLVSPGYNNRFRFETESYTVARYVKVVAIANPKIGYGSGAGYPAWLFVSEIIVE